MRIFAIAPLVHLSFALSIYLQPGYETVLDTDGVVAPPFLSTAPQHIFDATHCMATFTAIAAPAEFYGAPAFSCFGCTPEQPYYIHKEGGNVSTAVDPAEIAAWDAVYMKNPAKPQLVDLASGLPADGNAVNEAAVSVFKNGSEIEFSLVFNCPAEEAEEGPREFVALVDLPLLETPAKTAEELAELVAKGDDVFFYKNESVSFAFVARCPQPKSVVPHLVVTDMDTENVVWSAETGDSVFYLGPNQDFFEFAFSLSEGCLFHSAPTITVDPVPHTDKVVVQMGGSMSQAGYIDAEPNTDGWGITDINMLYLNFATCHADAASVVVSMDIPPFAPLQLHFEKACVQADVSKEIDIMVEMPSGAQTAVSKGVAQGAFSTGVATVTKDIDALSLYAATETGTTEVSRIIVSQLGRTIMRTSLSGDLADDYAMILPDPSSLVIEMECEKAGSVLVEVAILLQSGSQVKFMYTKECAAPTYEDYQRRQTEKDSFSYLALFIIGCAALLFAVFLYRNLKIKNLLYRRSDRSKTK